MAGLENNTALCRKVLEPMSHEVPLEVIPFPDLHNCSSSQLHVQLNHLLGKALAGPALSGPTALVSLCRLSLRW